VPPGPNARDKPAPLAHVVGQLVGVEDNGNIEVAEENNSGNVEQRVEWLAPGQRLRERADPRAVARKDSDGDRRTHRPQQRR